MVELSWNDRTLGRLVSMRAQEFGDRTFLYFRDQEISYRELDDKSNAVANSFRRLGIEKGDKVAIMMLNCPEYLYVWFGLAKIGAIEVPINTAYRGDLFGYVIEHSDSRWVVIHDQLADRLGIIQENLSKVEGIVVHSESGVMPTLNLPQKVMPLADLLDGPTEAPRAEVKASDTFAIMYTSGTTGRSKGAMLPHACAFAFGMTMASGTRCTSEDVLYTCLPLFHANAQCMSITPALLAGARFALSERFHATRFWDEIRRYNATVFNYIGGILTMLYKQPETPEDRNVPARAAWGAAAPANLWKAIEERFGLQILEGYGLTESGAVLANAGPVTKVGSMGKLHGLYDVTVVDADDQELGPNQVGQIVSRPRTPFGMMTGYYKMPEQSLEAFQNLWFHTGDLGYYDEEGYFFFVDRQKDAIRRRGENISSFEVEKVINAHPKVLETAALAHPSEVGEDEVRVAIILKEGQTMTPEDLMAWCEERMAYFMVPRFVEFRTSLPKTPTDRVEKYKLRQEGLAPNAWDRERAGYKLKK